MMDVMDGYNNDGSMQSVHIALFNNACQARILRVVDIFFILMSHKNGGCHE